MSGNLTRRQFVQRSAVAAGVAAGLSTARSYAANERIRLAFIGVANRGGQLIAATKPHTDAEIVAVCDVDTPTADQCAEKLGGNIDRYSDYRRILERKDIDAVVIATPDHWHALQTVDACEAGKDVYIEKPLSMTVFEGRRMIEAARRNQRLVQVGLHRRSGPLFYQLADYIAAGNVGKITMAHCNRISNMAPGGIGKEQPCDPPPGLDWDMWLGPRAMRPYQPNITPYKFRWWKDYSSQIGNWGIHYFDTLRWLLGEESPVAVTALGGKYGVDDDRSIPDTMQAVFEFASGRILTFTQTEASNNPMYAKNGEFELRGTQGTIYATDRFFEVVPERGGQFQEPAPRMEPLKVEHEGPRRDMTSDHIRDFLDCIKTRNRPRCDVEDGHLSSIFAHLGNIALETRSRIDWDPKAERITNNEAANALLHYEYREPWKLA